LYLTELSLRRRASLGDDMSSTALSFAGGGIESSLGESESVSPPTVQARADFFGSIGRMMLMVHEAIPSYRGSLAEVANRYVHDCQADYITFGDELQRVKDIRKTIYSSLSALDDDDGEFGYRTWHVAGVLDRYEEDVQASLQALSEVLLTSTSDIGDDARVAALRYASSRRAYSRAPEMLSLCFSSLESEIEQQAVAAARTLGDLGEPATLPQMRVALKNVKWGRAKEELHNSVMEIERSYGLDQGSP